MPWDVVSVLNGSTVNAGLRHGLTGLISRLSHWPTVTHQLLPLAGSDDVWSFAEEIHIRERVKPCVIKRLKRKSGPLGAILQSDGPRSCPRGDRRLWSPSGIELTCKKRSLRYDKACVIKSC